MVKWTDCLQLDIEYKHLYIRFKLEELLRQHIVLSTCFMLNNYLYYEQKTT